MGRVTPGHPHGREYLVAFSPFRHRSWVRGFVDARWGLLGGLSGLGSLLEVVSRFASRGLGRKGALLSRGRREGAKMTARRAPRGATREGR